MQRIFLVTMLLSGYFIHAQNFVKLDSLMKVLLNHKKFMGQVAIIRDNEELFAKSYGCYDSDMPIKNTTPMRIGSVSKTFTAAMIFQQIETGNLNPEDLLADFYPVIPNAESITID